LFFKQNYLKSEVHVIKSTENSKAKHSWADNKIKGGSNHSSKKSFQGLKMKLSGRTLAWHA
jgi:hypothetical protein